MIVTRKLVSFCKEDEMMKLFTDGAEIHLWFMKDDVLRIRAGFDSAFEEASYTLVETAWDDGMDEYMQQERHRIKPACFTVKEGKDSLLLSGVKLNVVVEKDPFRICVFDHEGTCLHEDVEDLCYRLDRNHIRMHTSRISERDRFYGFGEKTGVLNKAQTYLIDSPSDAMGYDPKNTDSLYKHIPFYIKLNADTRKAVGYFYNNTSVCSFDMGRSYSNYWGKCSTYRACSGDLDLFLFVGPTMKEVIEHYTDLTGKSAFLPRYALGYLASSMYYAELPENCDDAILQFVHTAENEKIPMDGFQLSSGYTVQADNKRCTFTWNRNRFKDPRKWMHEMEQHGITVSCNVKPGMLTVHPLLKEMIQKNMFIKTADGKEPAVGTWWGGKGCFVDFTSIEARHHWRDYLKKNVLAYGTSSVWNDNCEYESIVDEDSRCALEGNGAALAQVRPVLANLMCKEAVTAIHEMNEDSRPYVVCRSGHAGIQRYAQTWAGDNRTAWETLEYNIATMLGMGLSGVSNQGCDVGGFYGPAPEPELFVRWVQNGIFMPRFSIHSVNLDNTVTEPWMYPQYTDLIRRAIQLRYQFIPYTYSLMHEAHESGLPMMRAMVLEYQDDERVDEEGVDFMLGSALLVANVVKKGAKDRTVYFPKGEVFYGFMDRVRYEGGKQITFPVQLDSILMFIRGGSILPMAENRIGNLHADEVKSIHWIIAPDRNSSFTLYEDDGKSMKYQNGEYRKTKVDVTAGKTITIGFTSSGDYESPIESVLLDVLCPDTAPYSVNLQGKTINRILYQPAFEKCETGWYYDMNKKTVLIRYPVLHEDHEVQISLEPFDMIGM